MPGLTRRQRMFCALPLGFAGVTLARQAPAGCVEPESESLRASLKYVTTAADQAATCTHCAFYTAMSGGACGTCTILGGPVDATGHCDSFSQPA
jgi:hypothetical protein